MSYDYNSYNSQYYNNNGNQAYGDDIEDPKPQSKELTVIPNESDESIYYSGNDIEDPQVTCTDSINCLKDSCGLTIEGVKNAPSLITQLPNYIFETGKGIVSGVLDKAEQVPFFGDYVYHLRQSKREMALAGLFATVVTLSAIDPKGAGAVFGNTIFAKCVKGYTKYWTPTKQMALLASGMLGGFVVDKLIKTSNVSLFTLGLITTLEFVNGAIKNSVAPVEVDGSEVESKEEVSAEDDSSAKQILRDIKWLIANEHIIENKIEKKDKDGNKITEIEYLKTKALWKRLAVILATNATSVLTTGLTTFGPLQWMLTKLTLPLSRELKDRNFFFKYGTVAATIGAGYSLTNVNEALGPKYVSFGVTVLKQDIKKLMGVTLDDDGEEEINENEKNEEIKIEEPKTWYAWFKDKVRTGVDKVSSTKEKCTNVAKQMLNSCTKCLPERVQNFFSKKDGKKPPMGRRIGQLVFFNAVSAGMIASTKKDTLLNTVGIDISATLNGGFFYALDNPLKQYLIPALGVGTAALLEYFIAGRPGVWTGVAVGNFVETMRFTAKELTKAPKPPKAPVIEGPKFEDVTPQVKN